MILVVDVGYSENTALVAGILFKAWDSEEISQEILVSVKDVAEYIPGQFYLRELPCIAKLLTTLELETLNCIVIDGYVDLGVQKKAGLGMKLWQYLDGKIPVIGVAKSKFIDTPKNTEIVRGDSIKPLFVTAIGIEQEEAKSYILKMKGKYRIPDFLKMVDKLSRKH